MTVYRLISPTVMMRGSIDEILQVLAGEIDQNQYYFFDDSEDIRGTEVVERLLELKEQADAPHSYVENIAFGRSVGGNPGDYRITRIDPTTELHTIS